MQEYGMKKKKYSLNFFIIQISLVHMRCVSNSCVRICVAHSHQRPRIILHSNISFFCLNHFAFIFSSINCFILLLLHGFRFDLFGKQSHPRKVDKNGQNLHIRMFVSSIFLYLAFRNDIYVCIRMPYIYSKILINKPHSLYNASYWMTNIMPVIDRRRTFCAFEIYSLFGGVSCVVVINNLKKKNTRIHNRFSKTLAPHDSRLTLHAIPCEALTYHMQFERLYNVSYSNANQRYVKMNRPYTEDEAIRFP